MSYSKVFSPEKYETISNVIEAAQGLSPGGAVTVTSETPEASSLTRSLLYDYLFHMSLKGKFRIKCLDPKTLVIRRLGFRISPKVSPFGEKSLEERSVETQPSEKMIERLIELWGEPEAEATLKNWIETKAISLEEGEELWTHVKRIMS